MFDRTKGQVLAKAFEPLTKTYLRAFQKAGESSLRAIDTSVDDGAIIRCLKKDTTKNKANIVAKIKKIVCMQMSRSLTIEMSAN